MSSWGFYCKYLEGPLGKAPARFFNVDVKDDFKDKE